MNKFTAFVATLALAGSARSQMVQTVVAPAGAPVIAVPAALAAGLSLERPVLTASPTALAPSLMTAAPAPLPTPPVALTPVLSAPVKAPYGLPGPVVSARLAAADAGVFDGLKARAGDASPVAERPLPRGAGLSEPEARAKISADPALGARQLKVVFPAGTTAEKARATLTRLELLAWLSPARATVPLRRAPGGGYYAVFTPSSTASRAVMAGYALARRPETRSVTLGRDLQRAWDRLNK